MSPLHSISTCPVCGGGLCGIRICGLPTKQSLGLIAETDPPFGGEAAPPAIDRTIGPHGLVICDECEAIWLDPDTTTEHQYNDAEDARCPICRDSLWNGNNHWANAAEIALLGWENKTDPKLDFVPSDLDGPGAGHLNMGGDIA